MLKPLLIALFKVELDLGTMLSLDSIDMGLRPSITTHPSAADNDDECANIVPRCPRKPNTIPKGLAHED